MIDLRREGDVHVLRLDDGENRFTAAMLDGMSAALDEVTRAPGPRALVITGTGKFFSAGLELDRLGVGSDGLGPYIDQVHGLFARLLTLPMPTVAALNGHVVAAGAMLGLTCDYQVMRADRGYFMLPEVDLGLPFTPGMIALLLSRLPAVIAHEAMVTGRRYGGEEAVSAGIVHQATAESEVVSTAIALAEPLAAKDGETIAQIRTGMYQPVLDVLNRPFTT